MISEQALARSCRQPVMSRALALSRRTGRISERSCSYEGRLTHLEALVDSASSATLSYEASITIDEVADEVFSYDCSCPAAQRFSGPCKHSVAIALDYNRNPEAYLGPGKLGQVSTSSVLRAYLDRVGLPAQARVSRDTGELPATVHLVPRLVLDGELFCNLRVQGPRGAYVVRDLDEFEERMTQGSFFSYGPKLAFAHDPDAFVEADRALVDFVCRCVQNRRSYGASRVLAHRYAVSGSQGRTGKELRLSGPEADELLGLLMGRMVALECPANGVQPTFSGLVEVVEGDPELSLSVVAEGEGGYRIERREGLRYLRTSSHLYLLQGTTLHRCTPALAAAAPFIQQVYCSQAGDLLLSREDARRFAAQVLPQVERAMPVQLDESFCRLRPEPLALTFRLDCAGKLVTCDAVARYGTRELPLFERVAPAEAVWRDVAAEVEAREVVGRYFTTARDGRLLVSRPDADSVARIVYEGVIELARIGTVEVTDAFEALSRRRRPQVQVSVRAQRGGGLIDLSMHADDLPSRELHALLDSYRLRRHYHRLRDGSIVELTDDGLAEAARLAEELGLTARELAAGEAHVPSYKAFLLDALVPDEEKDASFVELLEDFRTVDLDAYEPPASLAPRLRPYQVAGFRWLSGLIDLGFGGILADEMGLGKSVQVISVILARRGRGPTLVVCPASLVYNWVAEFGKFAPQLDVVAVAGTAQERRQVRSERSHEVFVTSYDLLRRDVEDYASRQFWCVVLDEAQFVKNHQTLAARAVKALDARHRLALTGTPVENRLSELWSIFDFLMPGLLGGLERFRDRYELPISEGDERAAETLRSACAPFILRRTKAEVAVDLPEKLEQVVTCRMMGEQRSLYAAREQALREQLASGSGRELGRESFQVLAELTRLRQLCCDPRLVYEDYDGGSAKLDTICQLVQRALDAREKVLVFSQFTSFLALIAERLDREGTSYHTITGATPKQRRVELVEAFNTDDTPVFLVSLRAGGTGLNLVGAQVVIHADPWWNLAVQDQATDRAHRIGQTRTVTVYKVVCAESIEERIVALQEAKASLAREFVGTGDGSTSLAALTREDLLRLLDDEE